MFSKRPLQIGQSGRPHHRARGARPFLAGFHWFILLIATVAFALAQTNPEDIIPTDRPYSNEWKETRDQLVAKRNELKWFHDEYKRDGDFVKFDLTLLTKDYQENIFPVWEKVLAAWKRGALEEARALRKKAPEAKTATDWRERFNRRRNQSEAWPREDWVKQYESRKPGTRSHTYFPTWLAAKRACSIAWGKVADAMVPGADPKQIVELTEQAHAAAGEAHMKEVLWSAYERRDQWAPELTVTSPELTQVVEALTALENDDVTWRKFQVENERRQRELDRNRQINDRRRQVLEENFRKTYAAALAARNQKK